MQNIVITAEDKQRLESILAGFLEDSGARNVLLVDRGGFVIMRWGDFTGVDPQSLAVLASGSFASTHALAQHIGEKEFSAAFHQGKQSNVHLSIIAEYALLVAIFDATATVGMIRLYAREAAKKLEPIISDMITRRKKRPPASGTPTASGTQGAG